MWKLGSKSKIYKPGAGESPTVCGSPKWDALREAKSRRKVPERTTYPAFHDNKLKNASRCIRRIAATVRGPRVPATTV